MAPTWSCLNHFVAESSEDYFNEEEDRRQTLIVEDDEDDKDDELFRLFLKKKRKFQNRPGGSNAHGRKNYWHSVGGRMLQDPELKYRGSRARKTFMRRFRVPYPIFVRLAEWTKEWHDTHLADASGRKGFPTELQVLGWLCMVGRGLGFEDLEELSGISVSTMPVFSTPFQSIAVTTYTPCTLRCLLH